VSRKKGNFGILDWFHEDPWIILLGGKQIKFLDKAEGFYILTHFNSCSCTNGLLARFRRSNQIEILKMLLSILVVTIIAFLECLNSGQFFHLWMGVDLRDFANINS